MRILISFGLFIFINISVFGTKQILDIIVYKGDTCLLLFNPMESYFKTYPEKNPLQLKDVSWSTALYRSYVAIFEIVDNTLYLKDIKISLPNTIDERGWTVSNWKSVRDTLFPDQESIVVNWETGLIIFSSGIENYNPFISGRTYKQYVILEMDSGKVVKKKVLNAIGYEKFKNKQLRAFKKTDEYTKIKEQDWSNRYLKSNIARFTSKILYEE